LNKNYVVLTSQMHIVTRHMYVEKELDSVHVFDINCFCFSNVIHALVFSMLPHNSFY